MSIDFEGLAANLLARAESPARNERYRADPLYRAAALARAKRRASKPENAESIRAAKKRWRDANREKRNFARSAKRRSLRSAGIPYYKYTRSAKISNSELFGLSRKEVVVLSRKNRALRMAAFPEIKAELSSKANARYRKRKENPLLRAKANMRSRVSQAIKRGNLTRKNSLSITLGANAEQLRAWLSAQFSEGMNWSNYGQWHIDHKKPLALAASIEELEALCHYTNLQPLWKRDNMSKGARYVD